jgi:hypothetical protein
MAGQSMKIAAEHNIFETSFTQTIEEVVYAGVLYLDRVTSNLTYLSYFIISSRQIPRQILQKYSVKAKSKAILVTAPGDGHVCLL